MDLPNILSKTNNNNNNSDGRILDADTEWRDRSEAEAGTSAYNDDDGDEAFHFFLHELFPEVCTPHVHHYVMEFVGPNF